MAGAARVRTGGDGGAEGGSVGAVVDQAALQFQCEMPLGAADEDRFEQFAQGLVGDLGGDPQMGDLLLVLDRALLFDGAAEVREVQPGSHRADGAVPGDGQMVLLDGERAQPGRVHEVGGGDGRVSGGGGQDAQPQEVVGTAGGGVLGGTARAEQDVPAVVGTDQQDGARRGSAGEIADIGGQRHQGGVAAGGGAPVAQPPATDRIHL